MIEVMKQALEALNYLQGLVDTERGPKAAAALRQAIEQAEKQEPVAWMCSDESVVHKGYSRFSKNCEGAWNIPVYTTAQREWVGLTDEEIDDIWRTHLHRDSRVQAIEAKLKEKNT